MNAIAVPEVFKQYIVYVHRDGEHSCIFCVDSMRLCSMIRNSSAIYYKDILSLLKTVVHSCDGSSTGVRTAMPERWTFGTNNGQSIHCTL